MRFTVRSNGIQRIIDAPTPEDAFVRFLEQVRGQPIGWLLEACPHPGGEGGHERDYLGLVSTWARAGGRAEKG